MIETVPLTLPGGYTLPVSLETATLREYEAVPAAVSAEEAEARLTVLGLRLIAVDMIAGSIEERHIATTRTDDVYTAELTFHCTEVISRTVPARLFGEEVDYGEIDQRGAN